MKEMNNPTEVRGSWQMLWKAFHYRTDKAVCLFCQRKRSYGFTTERNKI